MPTLLVALDGSSFADAALPVAVGLARQLRADLVLASVLDADPRRYATGGAPFADRRLEHEHEAEWRTAVQRYLDGARARIAALPDAPRVDVTLLSGSVADSLLAHAETIDADLIVITTHGRGGISRAWLGSVTEALVRMTTRPIVAVRPSEEPPPPDTMPEWRLQRVLVPLDGSFASEQVLLPLRPLFRDGTECVLMRAVSPLHPMLRAVTTPAEYDRDLASQRALVAGYLQEVEAHLRAGGVHATHCAHEELDPARAICACADLLHVDLIALATRGHSAVEQLLLGSVADKVVRSTDRPVLLHRIVEPVTTT